MSEKHSFAEITDQMIRELSNDVELYIETVISALMPDGRPLGMEERTQDEELLFYLGLRGDASKWWNWIAERVEHFIALASERLPPDKVEKLHPWDIVFRFALNYSAKMEQRLRQKIAREGEQFVLEARPLDDIGDILEKGG